MRTDFAAISSQTADWSEHRVPLVAIMKDGRVFSTDGTKPSDAFVQDVRARLNADPESFMRGRGGRGRPVGPRPMRPDGDIAPRFGQPPPRRMGPAGAIIVDGVPVRLLLAKNPAGWLEVLDIIGDSTGPVVVGINARIADGKDPSWLWDVPFERLRGRYVVAAGERSHDLAVRLRYAEVQHQSEPELHRAVKLAADRRTDGESRVDVVANYTSFMDFTRDLPDGVDE